MHTLAYAIFALKIVTSAHECIVFAPVLRYTAAIKWSLH